MSTVTTLGGVRQRVHRRAVHLRERPVAVRVLDPGRRPGCRPPAGRGHPAATRCWPGCGRARCTAAAYGSSEPRTASSDRAAITTAARISRARSAQASAASPSVAALLLMKPSASAGRSAKRGGGPAAGGSQARSPIRHSPVAASAVRSPVPIAPYRGTGGVKPRLIASASTSSTAGSTPEPPAPIWFSRITSMARARSGAQQRARRRPRGCAAGAARARPVRPRPARRCGWRRPRWSSRRPAAAAATSRAICQAARAAATAAGATVTLRLVPGRPPRPAAQVSDAPSITMRSASSRPLVVAPCA